MNWLARIFVTVAVRRVVVLLVIAVLGWLGISSARAVDRGEAFALCNAAIARTMTRYGPVTANNWPRVEINCRESVGPPELKKGVFAASVLVNPSTPVCISSEGAVPSTSCQFEYRGSCESRAVLQNASYQGPSYCQQGCAYVPDDVAPLNPNSIDFSFFNQDRIIKHAKRLRPTGAICESLPNPPDAPQPDVCVTQGTLTQCVTPEGKHCASGASGKKYCWDADEHGTKTSGNEAMTKSPVDKPVNLPPVPPKNGGEWEKKGEGTVSTTINNNTDNSKITNNVSNYGDKGSGAAGGGSDGEGNGGSGDGSGKGDGEGEGGKGDFGSVGGGTCEGGFTCTGGDPVLCAIAQQQYQARCEAEGRFGDGAGAGDFPGGGEGDSDPDPEDYNKTVKVGLSMIDTGGLGMPTQCPTFEAISTSFGDFSVDAESWCQILGVARSCLLFLGAFMSLGILMGWGGKD
ncbi:hypothetical protein ABE493_01025 [Stenotrophomonas terrae]|uniref:hypothetical protein n=1 Tax=Stenotrophomonas terrae TaxID=405446 RepID=UPI00320B449E